MCCLIEYVVLTYLLPNTELITFKSVVLNWIGYLLSIHLFPNQVSEDARLFIASVVSGSTNVRYSSKDDDLKLLTRIY